MGVVKYKEFIQHKEDNVCTVLGKITPLALLLCHCCLVLDILVLLLCVRGAIAFLFFLVFHSLLEFLLGLSSFLAVEGGRDG